MKILLMLTENGDEVPLYRCATIGEAMVAVVQGLTANGIRVLSKRVDNDNEFTVLTADMETMKFRLADMQ